jgi:hypothetical protein
MCGRSETDRSEACTRRRGAARGIERQHFKLHSVLHEQRFRFCPSLAPRRSSRLGFSSHQSWFSIVRKNVPTLRTLTELVRARSVPRREPRSAAVTSSVQTVARVRGSCDARSPERASEAAYRVRERQRRRARSARAAWRGERRGERPAESERIWAPGEHHAF